MRIFALQTDINKIQERFCHKGEQIVHMTYYHGLSFFFAIIKEIFLTLTLITVGVIGFHYGWPVWWMLGILVLIWLVFVVFNVTKAYIDWNFDFIMVTTDKVILVDQTSIFKQEVKPIHVENIGGISTSTQFWDVFPFGQLTIHLKEGLGGDMLSLKYVPRVNDVASAISDVVTTYQRRGYTGTSTENLTDGGNLGGMQNPQ